MATFELSYAGVPFVNVETVIDDWIAKRIPREYLEETVPDPDWISRTMQALSWPRLPARPHLAINELYYPTGAARWAEFRGLATESQAQQMITAVYDHTVGTQLAPFVMHAEVTGESQDRDPLPTITTNMYMLPPRPLAQTDNGRDGLYLVTLVDERYYGYLSPTPVQFDNGTTWSAYLSSVATSLGITLTVPTIPVAYGNPSLDSSLWATYENAAYLLDSAAWNVGMVVVRQFNGTYTLIPWTNAGAYNTTRPKFNIAGGAFADALDPQNLIPALEAVLPHAITVTFPKYQSRYGYIDQTGTVAKPGRYIPRVNEPYLDVYAITVPITQATATDVLGNAITSYQGIGTKVLKTTGKAYFSNFTDAVPVNNADCNALATAMANDYWTAVGLGLDEVYLGIRGWQPEAVHDVIWTFRKDRPATRAIRKPWNFWPTDFQHELVPNLGNQDGPNAGPALELVLCNTNTADGSGRYDSLTATKIGAGQTETGTGGEAVWLHSPNGDTLVSGSFYLARLMQVESGRKLYDVSKQPPIAYATYQATAVAGNTIAAGVGAFVTLTTGTATAGFTIDPTGVTITAPLAGIYAVGFYADVQAPGSSATAGDFLDFALTIFNEDLGFPSQIATDLNLTSSPWSSSDFGGANLRCSAFGITGSTTNVPSFALKLFNGSASNNAVIQTNTYVFISKIA